MTLTWFRCYHEVLNDRKLTRVSVLTGEEKPYILGIWTGLLCLANDSPQRGELLLADEQPVTVPEMASTLGTTEGRLTTLLEAFVILHMIDNRAGTWIVVHFQNRNFASDDSGPRVRAHRAKQADETADDAEMKRPCNGAVTPDVTHQIRPDQIIVDICPQKEADTPSPSTAGEHPDNGLTVAGKEYFRQFRRKRWSTQAQRDAFELAERDVGTDTMLAAVTWAATKNIADVGAIAKTARKMAHEGNGQCPGRIVAPGGGEL